MVLVPILAVVPAWWFGKAAEVREGRALIMSAVCAAMISALASVLLVSPFGRSTFLSMERTLGLAVLAVLVALAPAWVGMSMHEPQFSSHDLHPFCFFATIGLALTPGVVLGFVFRQSEIVAPGRMALCIGMVAGSWAATAMTWICPRNDWGHVLAMHVVAVALSSIVLRDMLARSCDALATDPRFR